MEKSISYHPSIASNSYKEFSIPMWDSCVANYEQGNYHQSFLDFLNYLDPNIFNEYANPEKTVFNIPHGSAVIILRIENGHLYIECPFLKLPETKFMPILRKCSEINFSYMTLPNIKLKDNVMKFLYDMPLELCNPWKLYDVLRNITFNADKYDDEFVTKFGAERIIEPMLTNYDQDKLEHILAACKEIAKELLEYSQYFETKRNLNVAVDCIFIGISRLRHYCSPTGILLNKMNETIDTLYDRNKDMFDKIKAGKALFKYVEDITLEDFKEYCAITFSLIPDKRSVNRNYIENWIEDHLKSAEDAYDSDDFAGSSFYCYYALYYALSYFNITTDDRKIIEYGLKQAAGKKWKEAADAMLDVMNFFFQNTGEEFHFEAENSAESNAFNGFDGFDMDSYMKTVQESMNQMMSGFMASFAQKK